MKIFKEESLANFEFWSGAKDRAKKLTDQELDQIESILEEIYPEGMDEVKINDLFWFDFETVLEWIGKEECPECGEIFEAGETCECQEEEGDHMKKKINWNENFDLNEHGDFFATEVEYEEGSRYVYYRGTYRNGEGQEFPNTTLEVFLSDPVYLDADGNIVIPAAWENFWVLGHELP